MKLKIMSLNGEDMIDLVKGKVENRDDSAEYWRARLLAAMIQKVDPDILGLVEAPTYENLTREFVKQYLLDSYDVHQGEKRGSLGLAFLVKKNKGITVNVCSKDQCNKNFKLREFDADSDGIEEIYSWWNRVPVEAEFSGGGIEKTVFILVHAKSKGAFIAGDLFAYDKLSRANRMKLKAQADAVRNRLDKLIDKNGKGRVVVMGDMNDGPEFDIQSALLGGAFLEKVMGSIWEPAQIMYNCHYPIKPEYRWTIDFQDRIVNPLGKSRYGQPSELRSWIDHILVSPELKPRIVPGSCSILHKQPKVDSLPEKYMDMRATDHHPPYVTLDL